MKPAFKDPQTAFAEAIKQGRLSDNPDSPLYAGHYMYMGPFGDADAFKHITTRQYLPKDSAVQS